MRGQTVFWGFLSVALATLAFNSAKTLADDSNVNWNFPAEISADPKTATALKAAIRHCDKMGAGAAACYEKLIDRDESGYEREIALGDRNVNEAVRSHIQANCSALATDVSRDSCALDLVRRARNDIQQDTQGLTEAGFSSFVLLNSDKWYIYAFKKECAKAVGDHADYQCFSQMMKKYASELKTADEHIHNATFWSLKTAAILGGCGKTIGQDKCSGYFTAAAAARPYKIEYAPTKSGSSPKNGNSSKSGDSGTGTKIAKQKGTGAADGSDGGKTGSKWTGNSTGDGNTPGGGTRKNGAPVVDGSPDGDPNGGEGGSLDGVAGGMNCKDKDCSDKPLVGVTDTGPDMSWTGQVVKCPDFIAEHNCGLYSGHEADPTVFAQKKGEMAEICRSKVKEKFPNGGSTLCGPTLTKSGWKGTCEQAAAIYAKMEADPAGPAACQMWFEVINGMDHVPNFKTRDEIELGRKIDGPNEAIKGVLQGVSDALEVEGKTKLGAYSVEQSAQALIAGAAAELATRRAAGIKDAGNQYEMDQMIQSLTQATSCLPSKERDDLKAKLLKVKDEVLKKLPDDEKNRTSASETAKTLMAAAGKVYQLNKEHGDVQQTYNTMCISSPQSGCGEIKDHLSNLEAEIEDIRSQFPLLAENVSNETSYNPTKIETVTLETALAPDHTRLSTPVELVDRAQRAAFSDGVAHLQDVCSDKDHGLENEGGRVSAFEPVVKGFMSCSDLDAKSEDCANRQSYGWVLCRSFYSDLAQKNEKAMHEFYVKSLEISGMTALSMFSGPFGEALLGEESAVFSVATITEKGVNAFKTAGEINDLVGEATGENDSANDKIRSKAQSDFQNGWTSYSEFKEQWDKAKDNPLAAAQLAETVIENLFTKENISKIGVDAETAERIEKAAEHIPKQKLIERVQVFLDTGKLRLPESDDEKGVNEETIEIPNEVYESIIAHIPKKEE